MPLAPRLIRNVLGIAVLLTVAMLLGLWNGASAWIFKADLRKASNLASVGLIEFNLPEGRSRGTAFLVGNCAVMTNFHVVFGPWYLTALHPPSRSNVGTFTLTQVTLAEGRHPATEAVPVIWGDYTGADRQIRKPAEDWVLLALKDCLGTRHGYLKPFDARLNDDIPARGGFSAIGYSSGRQMIDGDCSIRVVADKPGGASMLHDCAAISGDSGSPLVRRGTGLVVGMISSVHADWGTPRCSSSSGVVREIWDSHCTNVAVPFSYTMIDRVEAVREAILVQNQLLSLGYDAGLLGAIEGQLFHQAIEQYQHDSGFVPTGSIDGTLRKSLWIRTLRI